MGISSLMGADVCRVSSKSNSSLSASYVWALIFERNLTRAVSFGVMSLIAAATFNMREPGVTGVGRPSLSSHFT